jgi:hypothetical protein
VQNGTIKATLESFLSGTITSFTELSFIELILSSEVDVEIIRILTDQDPNDMDMFAGFQVLADFFGYIASNKLKLSALLASFGYQIQKTKNKKPTTSKSSK